MAIRGNLSEASLPDVLQLLAMGSKTGCLTLNVDDASGSIYFENGLVCYASLSTRTLDTHDAVFAMFNWTHGAFSFEPGENPPAGVLRTAVDPQELLLEGARRVDEWSLIEKKVPNFEIVFALDRQQMLHNTIAFSREQQVLLPLIDGRTVPGWCRTQSSLSIEISESLFTRRGCTATRHASSNA